jgi:sulfopyruvate decarboxylase subunit alpha
MNSREFCELLKNSGFDFFSGVPCSLLGPIIEHLSHDKDLQYVPATREDEALGIAVGAYMGGKKPAVLMQNSGLGNSIDALTSLVLLYKFPILLVISWRGFEENDFIEHSLMGKYMQDFLKTMKIPTLILSTNDLPKQIAEADQMMKKTQTPVALILKKEVVE